MTSQKALKLLLKLLLWKKTTRCVYIIGQCSVKGLGLVQCYVSVWHIFLVQITGVLQDTPVSWSVQEWRTNLKGDATI